MHFLFWDTFSFANSFIIWAAFFYLEMQFLFMLHWYWHINVLLWPLSLILRELGEDLVIRLALCTRKLSVRHRLLTRKLKLLVGGQSDKRCLASSRAC